MAKEWRKDRDTHRHRQRKTQRHIEHTDTEAEKAHQGCRESSCIKRHFNEKLKITGWDLAGPV